ncbi:hypothetical protein D3C75_1004390 [compost metagenome]
MHGEHRLHLRAVFNRFVGAAPVHNQRRVITPKCLVALGDLLHRVIQFVGLFRLPFHRPKIRNVFFELALNSITILIHKRLHQGELELLLNRLVPHPWP